MSESRRADKPPQMNRIEGLGFEWRSRSRYRWIHITTAAVGSDQAASSSRLHHQIIKSLRRQFLSIYDERRRSDRTMAIIIRPILTLSRCTVME
jgi:hypothetical protein